MTRPPSRGGGSAQGKVQWETLDIVPSGPVIQPAKVSYEDAMAINGGGLIAWGDMTVEWGDMLTDNHMHYWKGSAHTPMSDRKCKCGAKVPQ